MAASFRLLLYLSVACSVSITYGFKVEKYSLLMPNVRPTTVSTTILFLPVSIVLTVYQCLGTVNVNSNPWRYYHKHIRAAKHLLRWNCAGVCLLLSLKILQFCLSSCIVCFIFIHPHVASNCC